ncbi:MAG: hydroxyisourate hydrolase [Myxococcales bacterium]|nr:hydroxyisourate hydrolase [Myxococcales bacterium]
MGSPLTTHVLDTAIGRPAEGIMILLERNEHGDWRKLAQGETNADGRITDLLPPGGLTAGFYRMTFMTAAYFLAQEVETFYPVVQVAFQVTRPEEHHHVPLLISPFGYSTYRGS